MSSANRHEKPFEFLRRKGNSEPFPAETIRNWYIARAYVLERLKDIGFYPGEKRHLTVTIDGDSPIMLSVARQVALSAHYINYEECDLMGNFSCRNRTLVSLVSQNEHIIEELNKEEYLGNLLRYGKYTVGNEVHNAESFIDIEFRIVEAAGLEGGEDIRITESEVLEWLSAQPEEEVFSVDTRPAVLSSRVYALGSVIDNLLSEDIHNAKRYRMALEIYQYRLLEILVPLVDSGVWNGSMIAVMNGLSNLFCADCFKSRALSVRRYAERERISETEAWEKINEPLSQSEHNRWVVEKLILGFRPLNHQERLRYESLFGSKRVVYADYLKERVCSPAHVDICSFRDLRRINPDDMKYDSFLMLAIPYILGRMGTHPIT